VFSLLTVFIGCRKPGKIAAQVSPVEAVKYSNVSEVGQKKAKKTRTVTTLSMAWANVTREKRKLCVIVLSLALALILLNGAYSASRSFDMDMYMSNHAISDFAVAHGTIYNLALVQNKETEGIRQDFMEELAALGITEMGGVFYYENIQHELTPTALENFNAQFEAEYDIIRRYYRYSVPLYQQRIAEGLLETQIYGLGKLPFESVFPDYDRLASGNYALTVAHGDTIPVYDVGDIITLTNEAGESREFEIFAVVDDYPYSIDVKYGFIPSQTIVLPDNAFIDFFKPEGALYSVFNVLEGRLAETEAWLSEYTTRINPSLGYVSRETLKAEFEGLQTTYLTMGGAMALILALVGVLNFINTVVASVITRRRELAMLQSVGMTGKQLRGTLFFEGLFYTVMTLLFTFTAGVGISLLIVRVMAGQTWFFKEYLTVMPSVYSIIPLFLICAVVPLICYKWLIRESLVERLRVE
jgi:putative ABC transport system permease protein